MGVKGSCEGMGVTANASIRTHSRPHRRLSLLLIRLRALALPTPGTLSRTR